MRAVPDFQDAGGCRVSAGNEHLGDTQEVLMACNACRPQGSGPSRGEAFPRAPGRAWGDEQWIPKLSGAQRNWGRLSKGVASRKSNSGLFAGGSEHLQRLRLNTARERLEALLQEASEKELSYADFLDGLLSEEVSAKTAKTRHDSSSPLNRSRRGVRRSTEN